MYCSRSSCFTLAVSPALCPPTPHLGYLLLTPATCPALQLPLPLSLSSHSCHLHHSMAVIVGSSSLSHITAACTPLLPLHHALAVCTSSIVGSKLVQGCTAPWPMLPGPHLIFSAASLQSALCMLLSLFSHSPPFLWPSGFFL